MKPINAMLFLDVIGSLACFSMDASQRNDAIQLQEIFGGV
jgi:hypothetical protein